MRNLPIFLFIITCIFASCIITYSILWVKAPKTWITTKEKEVDYEKIKNRTLLLPQKDRIFYYKTEIKNTLLREGISIVVRKDTVTNTLNFKTCDCL